ncbi:MAG: gliding motility lipoprotein GldH [Chlorobi bacterium]|nr:gliding motility lipoprotein GldH [Chlorobiota bacterium]
MKNLLFILTFLVLLSSCSDVYREFKKFDDLKWDKNDVKTFEVNINKDGEYDLFFALRHYTGYPFTTLKIEVTQIAPNGRASSKKIEIPVADENGKYIGDVSGELWDVENKIAEKVFLEKGKYTFKIAHYMNSNPVILVVDIGLIIRISN